MTTAQIIQEVGLFSLLPFFAMIIGGLIASFYTLSDRATCGTQHFAAGVVFAAVAKELLPKIGGAHGVISLIIGFCLGIVLMLVIKQYSENLAEKTKGSASNIGLLATVGVDLFIDGLLIGIAFLAGAQGGVLISIALGIEIFFLGLATTATLARNKVNTMRKAITALLLAIIVPIAAILGATIFSQFTGDVLNGVIAFGVAALLYLVTEELLLEAHESPVAEAPWITSLFFVGFLFILILES